MAHNQDYIPERDGAFDLWLANLAAYVDGKIQSGAWTHIPAEKAAALQERYAGFHARLEKNAGPHTSVDTRAKNDSRAAAEGFVRLFVPQYLKFDPVTGEDRAAMRVPSRRAGRSAAGKPETRALITGLRAAGGFRAEIRFQDEAAPDRRAVPCGMNGALLYYAVGPDKLTDYARLKDTALMTRSPFTLALGPEAEGRFLSCACRWQNRKGELGPWSETAHVAVS